MIGRRSQFNIFIRYGLGYKVRGPWWSSESEAERLFHILTLKQGSGRQWGLRRGRGRSSPTLEKALSITDNIPPELQSCSMND